MSGWDGFLSLRSTVFVMHADSEVLRQQQQVGTRLGTEQEEAGATELRPPSRQAATQPPTARCCGGSSR